MQEKYLVEIIDPETECGFQLKKFKTRQQIVSAYNIPLYVVNKVIKMSNDLSFKVKKSGHMVFRQVFNEMKIYLIRPKLLMS